MLNYKYESIFSNLNLIKIYFDITIIHNIKKINFVAMRIFLDVSIFISMLTAMSKISKINMRKILNSQKHSHCNHETPKLFSRVSPTMCKKCFPLRISFVNEKPRKNLWIWSPLIKTSWTENFIFCKMPRTDFELSWSNTLSRNFRCSFG